MQQSRQSQLTFFAVKTSNYATNCLCVDPAYEHPLQNVQLRHRDLISTAGIASNTSRALPLV